LFISYFTVAFSTEAQGNSCRKFSMEAKKPKILGMKKGYV